MDDLSRIWRTVLYFSLLSSLTLVRGDFRLFVNLVDYANPTGLCAECLTRLDQVTNATQLVPVCCDEPNILVNCNNTGDARCDTRFRWNIRPFGASLETRPVTIPNAPRPPYFFTDCTRSPSTCPFSEASATFNEGPTGLLGVTKNPLRIQSTSTPWMGRIQFFIEAVENKVPYIIDSLLVNLDSLQLGGDFTEEMMFTGFHNIATMTMSFRVECSPDFCGPNCTISKKDNPGVAVCSINGDVKCVDGWDMQQNCSNCSNLNQDPDTNCSTCLSGYSQFPTCSTIATTSTTQSQAPEGVSVPVVAGAVGGVLAAVLLIVVIVLLVVCLVCCQQKPSKRSLAVNTRYESVEAINEASPPPKAVLQDPQDEHDFDNPLYDTAPGENDYSAPWDTRDDGSSKPVRVSSSNSTHAVVMRVNSSEHFSNKKKGSVKDSNSSGQVQYASIDPVPAKQVKNNETFVTSDEHDYAEPPNALSTSGDHAPQPVYDRPITPPTQSYDYAEIADSNYDAQERVFDNTGYHGVYRTNSPLGLPSEAEQHYDLGQ